MSTGHIRASNGASILARHDSGSTTGDAGLGDAGKIAHDVVRLTTAKWLVRQVDGEGNGALAGFIHFHHGRYEALHLGEPLTRDFFDTIGDALGSFSANREESL